MTLLSGNSVNSDTVGHLIDFRKPELGQTQHITLK